MQDGAQLDRPLADRFLEVLACERERGRKRTRFHLGQEGANTGLDQLLNLFGRGLLEFDLGNRPLPVDRHPLVQAVSDKSYRQSRCDVLGEEAAFGKQQEEETARAIRGLGKAVEEGVREFAVK